MENKRVLLVDDESGFTRLLKLTLEQKGGYTVLEENDGSRAHHTARHFRPHIIFLDIVMPKVDGGDVAQQIKGDPLLKDTVIVFLTAIVSNKEASSHGKEFGGFPFLAKPVSIDSVIECIENHVQNV